jgi:hypothetical protein
MVFGGSKTGGSFFIGGSGHIIVRYSLSPAFILGRCGRYGAQKYCERLSCTDAENLSGEFLCNCGSTVRLSVPLGFRKGGF